MSILARLRPHLPYLRRHARALTGDRTIGDNYVRIALEALAIEARSEMPDVAPQIALYQAFHSIWRSSGARLEPRTAFAANRAEVPAEQLMRMTPRSREAFLLTTMEGFTLDEVALILGEDAADIESLVAEADAEIDAMLAAKVLIIEDEAMISADLEALLLDLGHQVTDIATTRAEAVASATRVAPDLILSDVQLADGSSGAEAVSDILELYNIPVVMITAFPERLLTGERPEPNFLITKPFQPGAVKAAIAQALFFHPRSAKQAA